MHKPSYGASKVIDLATDAKQLAVRQAPQPHCDKSTAALVSMLLLAACGGGDFPGPVSGRADGAA